ncbi:hypothetical protein Tco_0800693 [Tanacetum coccineum]|uniref:Retrotransposon gag domain-containing protein n=1 Tax=Tanacetum coccineum TaxID=301880 RepID=A0ABQ4ZUU3_9ASTR
MTSGDSDPEAEYALSKLLQIGTVAEYHNEFEMLINRVTGIPQSLLIPFYISGLKLHLQRELNLVSRPTTLGDVFSLARIIEAHFEDINNQAMDNISGDEERKNVKDQQVSERAINETADTITSLQSEVVSLDAKGEALETTSKDLEKKMLDLNPTLHDPQKVAVDQKKKHYKTKYALKINDEEVKKANSEATTKIRKLAKNSCVFKEEYGIPESREFSRHHLEDKVVVKEWGMIHQWSLHTLEVMLLSRYYPQGSYQLVLSLRALVEGFRFKD